MDKHAGARCVYTQAQFPTWQRMLYVVYNASIARWYSGRELALLSRAAFMRMRTCPRLFSSILAAHRHHSSGWRPPAIDAVSTTACRVLLRRRRTMIFSAPTPLATTHKLEQRRPQASAPGKLAEWRTRPLLATAAVAPLSLPRTRKHDHCTGSHSPPAVATARRLAAVSPFSPSNALTLQIIL